MPEHLIRLRRAWDGHGRRGEVVAMRRVDLPTTWPADSGSIRLARRFRAPPLDRDGETLALRLERVAGLRSVRLNGRELARPSREATALEIALDEPLPPSNLLELEFEPPAGTAWGEVALVIRRD